MFLRAVRKIDSDVLISRRVQPPPEATAFLIDLGPAAQVGIDSGGFVPGGTSTSYDGVHPTAARAAELGGQLSAAIKTTLGE
jgi:hypothetical protein